MNGPCRNDVLLLTPAQAVLAESGVELPILTRDQTHKTDTGESKGTERFRQSHLLENGSEHDLNENI